MTKFKAVSIHSSISLAIFFVLLYFIAVIWYPQPYFSADGGWQGIRIAFFVDVVLGPFLTFIVYKQGKPGLKFDLTVIALLQVLALTCGVLLIYQQRTAVVLFTRDAFHSVSAEQLADADIDIDAVEQLSPNKPPLVYLRLPTDKEERRKFVNQIMFFQGKPLFLLRDRYEEITPKALDDIFNYSLNISMLSQNDLEIKTAWEKFLKQHGGKSSDYAYIQLHCRYQYTILAMERRTGKVVDVLDTSIPFTAGLPYESEHYESDNSRAISEPISVGE